MSSAFPWVPLRDVVTPVVRVVVPVPGTIYRQAGVRLWGGGVYEREALDGAGTRYGALNRLETGDLVVNKIWARSGSVGVVSRPLAGSYVSSEFPTFSPKRDRVTPEWLHWLTKTEGFWQQCDQKSRGTSGKNRIQPEQFLRVTIPLPSLAEQRRIVTRIEELAGKIEEAKALRQEAQGIVGKVADSMARQLLASIPRSTFTAIESVAEVRGGIQKSPSRVPVGSPVRYLTVAHVHRNHISLDDPRYFEVSDSELDRWRLEAGDVLIIEGNGSADQIGRAALFRGEIEDCVHQNHVIRIRADLSRLDPEFLITYLNSPDGQEEVQRQSRTTSGLRTLSVGRIQKITMPIPPLQAQRRIVAGVGEMRRCHESVRLVQADTAAELDVLLPSILDRALKGEL